MNFYYNILFQGEYYVKDVVFDINKFPPYLPDRHGVVIFNFYMPDNESIRVNTQTYFGINSLSAINRLKNTKN